MMNHEYHEGPEAGEDFGQSAMAVYRTPTVPAPKKSEAKPKRRKRSAATGLVAVHLPESLV
jgi:hypothetical protein